MAYLKLDPEDIEAIANRIIDRLQPSEKEDDIIFLKDLASQWRKSYPALCTRRIDKRIPKVEGIKEVAIYRKYVNELKVAS